MRLQQLQQGHSVLNNLDMPISGRKMHLRQLRQGHQMLKNLGMAISGRKNN